MWEGIAEGKITDKMMKNPQATIDRVITDMFANYPVKAAAASDQTHRRPDARGVRRRYG